MQGCDNPLARGDEDCSQSVSSGSRDYAANSEEQTLVGDLLGLYSGQGTTGVSVDWSFYVYHLGFSN